VETIITVNVLAICVINAFLFSKGFSKGYVNLEIPNIKAFILQGHYAAQVGNYLPKRRLKNHQHSPCNTAEDRRAQFHGGGSLKSPEVKPVVREIAKICFDCPFLVGRTP
jgi:hypothetical protein